MSSEAMKWARGLQIADGGLTNLVNRLASYASAEGVCFPSQSRLAKDCGVSDRTVRSGLATLQALGVITRQVRSGGRHGRLSDTILLAMHRPAIEVDKSQIRALREKFQPEKISAPTGKIFRGISKRLNLEVPYQNKALSRTEIGEGENGRGGLRVIAGGRS